VSSATANVYCTYTLDNGRALRVSLNLESPIPAYRQIADDVRRHLVDEQLKPGDLLPPIRQLALDLGVHFNTVALAYRLLADEGLARAETPPRGYRDRAERAAGSRPAPG
jgi:DNA-binding transcriptional MocR family regulator